MKHSFLMKAIALSALAAPLTIFADIKPPPYLISYVGVDAQIRHMDFERNFGGKILQHRYPQANIFAGFKFNEYAGVEAGYTFSKKQLSTRPAGFVIDEALLPINLAFVSQTFPSRASSKISGWNANLMGYLPIFCKEDNTQLIGSIGFASLKSRIHQTLIYTAVFSDPLVPANTITRTLIDTTYFKKHKAVLRLGTGMQHMVCDNVGLRFLVNWENTSKLKACGHNPNRVSFASSRPQNSFHYGLGAFGTF